MRRVFQILILLFLFSCSNNKMRQGFSNEKCLPSIILIGYLGETNKPVYPLVIRTDESDTTYLKLIGFENEKFQKTGFIISKEYFRMSTVKPEIYSILKSYIIAHDTHKNRTIFNASANTMKVILIDKCDSIAYAVDKEEK